MTTPQELLDQSHLTILPDTPDPDLARIRETVAHPALVSNRAGLEDLLSKLIAVAPSSPRPKTLDLVGHTVAGSSLVALGSWVIDGSNQVVTSYFRGLADHDVLPRLGIHSVRLIGSLSAASPLALWTICALSDVLGVEVYGTNNLIYATHFDANGFSDDNARMLARASDLRRDPPSSHPLLVGDPTPRALDVDSLPADGATAAVAGRWPRRLASREQAGDLLKLVRRHDARAMPGLLLEPYAEIALPSGAAGENHVVEVLLDGMFVRAYPDGRSAPGVYYGVDAPRELIALVDALPQTAGG